LPFVSSLPKARLSPNHRIFEKMEKMGDVTVDSRSNSILLKRDSLHTLELESMAEK